MFSSRLGISVLVGASLLVGACKGGGAPKEDLALVPQDAEVVVGVNLARMRGTAMWKKMMDMALSQEKAKTEFAEFNKNCVDVNAADGPETVFIALPSPSKAAKDGAVLLRLKTAIDDAKLGKCAEYVATKNNEKLVTSEYGGKKIYNSGASADADKGGLALLDGKTVAFGSGAWLKKVIDLAGGKDQASAKKNEPLAALVKRAKTTDAIWGVGIVPASARESFKAQPQLAPMASLKAVLGSIDFASGLAVDVNMDTGSEADAKAINDQVTAQLAELKKSPQVMMLGMGPMIDPLKTEAKGPTFHVAIAYNQQQVDDMIARVQGLLKSFGGAMGGMGGPPPGMGGPPGQMPPPPGMPTAPPAAPEPTK
jgi:hypothetical protein